MTTSSLSGSGDEAVEERRGRSGSSHRFWGCWPHRVDDEQSGSPAMSSMAVAVAVHSAVALEVTFGVVGLRRADEEQSTPNFRGSAVAVVVASGVGLVGVDDEQSGSPEMSSVAVAVCSALAVVVAFGVVSLRRVDEEQSGSPEMSSVACSSEIKEDGLLFALRRNEVRKVKVAIINPFKVTGFETKERLRSSEIKDDSLRFVLRQNEERQRVQRGDHQPLQSCWF